MKFILEGDLVRLERLKEMMIRRSFESGTDITGNTQRKGSY